MKCEKQENNCAGSVASYFNGHIHLCEYHGNLLRKLQTISLLELVEMAHKSNFFNLDEQTKKSRIQKARIFALCSNNREFQKHVTDVYCDTYDYQNH